MISSFYILFLFFVHDLRCYWKNNNELRVFIILSSFPILYTLKSFTKTKLAVRIQCLFSNKVFIHCISPLIMHKFWTKVVAKKGNAPNPTYTSLDILTKDILVRLLTIVVCGFSVQEPSTNMIFGFPLEHIFRWLCPLEFFYVNFLLHFS